MPSTYSTNLALELIAQGEQAGTWGDTTNRNLGTLIEQAISGYTTQAVTDGADTTITIPDGATGVARNMYLELTGALTAARNVIVPAKKKLYFIYNNTTGGYAVTVKVSGQTGVSIDNGVKTVLVCNGTDTVSALSSLTGAAPADGDVGGPASSTDNALARFNGTTGKVLQNSSATLSDAGLLTATSFAGIGTSLTALNGSNISSGTVAQARLPTNVAYYDATTANFTGTLQYGGIETGYRAIPQLATAGRILALTDNGKHLSISSGSVTIPTNASVAFGIGTPVSVFNNSSGSISILASSGVTLRLAGTTTTGTRTVARFGLITLLKTDTNVWVASGSGLT